MDRPRRLLRLLGVAAAVHQPDEPLDQRDAKPDVQREEGLQPILAWIKRLCDAILIQLGAPNLEFAWRHDATIDPTVQRENLVALVNSGMMTRRRAAQIMGEILPDDPMADVPAITTGQGVAKLQQNWSANDEKKIFHARGFRRRARQI
ncbi:hypothetical protein M2322_003213 [Rhodoblastus acidophilus]|uniref:hypothetical protein n=1 Tax=Rhodoblastus acidophilus TaxID=1074 RepID=UPI0022243A66|nr:hypothetical protein [Rhodoblastus acidophilus]MCW2317649.1 hypothetical protein [Rhodoblastus acidophilus]